MRLPIAHDALAMIEYDWTGAVLLVADTDAAQARARRAAGLAGARVMGAVTLANGEAETLLERHGPADAIFVELDGSATADLRNRLLLRLDTLASAAGRRVIVTAPIAMIDEVAAGLRSGTAAHLADPTEAERVHAIARAMQPPAAVLHDVNRFNGTGLLQQLSEEAARIAQVLATLSEDDGSADIPAQVSGEEPSAAAPVDAAYVRTIIRARRIRDRFFSGALFADPAFDMLLDLYAARLEGIRVAVSSLCIAAAVPATTALRWIKTLTDRGLFVRVDDPQDGRRIYIELSEDAAKAMSRYLSAVQRIAPATI